MNHYGYYVLNLKPTILSFIGVSHPTPEWLAPDALLEHLPWWHGTFRSMLSKKMKQRQYERGGIHHGLMVNAPDEESMRKRFRVKGGYVSHQIYIDKDLLVPAKRDKKYQAVYIAQLQPFKRIHLASKLQSTLVISADQRDVQKYRQLVPNLTFNDRRLEKPEIAEAINSAHCTLALSKIEGAMLASYESLLCGIPVVSTPSKGGRNVFFNSYNSVIVKPSPEGVAEGVSYFCRNPRDPLRIRSAALADLEPHKLRFCTYVTELAVSLGGANIDPRERYQQYFAVPGGLSNLFIWVDKFELTTEIERVNARSFRG